jgi:uncharacterized repeat protein (TIGR01451 family)
MRTVVVGMLMLSAVAYDAGAASGGPDGFGYTFVDSQEPGGPAYRLIDIATTGTPVLVGTPENGGDDIASAPIDLTVGGTRPGFSLYGVTYPALVMTSNGYLTTDGDDTGNDFSNDCPLPQNPSVPVGTHGARLYPLHDDLALTPGIAAGFHQYFPSAVAAGRPPDRGPDVGVHVFLWKSATHVESPPSRFDFEALLYDDGDIVFLYGPGDPDAGLSSTTGIQDAAPPTTGLQIACNTGGSLAANRAVLILNPRFADVAVTKDVDAPAPTAGDTITYTVVAENRGRVDALGAQVTDPLPAGLTPVSLVPSAGTVDAASGVWSIPPLAPGASAVLTVMARVGLDQGGLNIVNVAARTALAAPLFDGVPGNDAAAVTITPRFRPPRIGFGVDRDGDGFSDTFETAADSDPGDGADTPFGVAATPVPLDVQRLRIRLNFARAERDAIRVSGSLPRARGFDLAGKTAVLDVGGVTARLLLDSRGKGAGAAAGGRARIRIGRARGGRAGFAARLRMGAFAAALATNADLGDADVRRRPRTVRVTLLLAPNVLVEEQAALYTATRGDKGRAHEAR